MYNAVDDEHEIYRIENALWRCREKVKQYKNMPEPVVPKNIVHDGKNGHLYISPQFIVKRGEVMIAKLEERLRELEQ